MAEKTLYDTDGSYTAHTISRFVLKQHADFSEQMCLDCCQNTVEYACHYGEKHVLSFNFF